MSDAKRALRTRMAARRKAVTAAERLEWGREIAARLVATSAWKTAQRVVLYADLPDEAPTGQIQLAAEAAGLPLMWPRISNDQLEFVVCPESSLVLGRFEIRTPPATLPASPLAAGDLLILPAVAFDRAGQRLGRGGGFYDRVLATHARRASSAAIGYDFQLVDEIPTEAHDVPVEVVVTNAGIWNPGIWRRETS